MTQRAPGTLFVLSAPSGAGKTSLARAAIDRMVARGVRVRFSVSYTTRAPRPGEEDGVHYHFVDEARFLAMIGRGEFLEHAQVFGRRYGTGRARTQAMLDEGCDVLLDIDWQGARQVKQLAPEAVSIFILPPSRAELERRLRGRGQDDEAVIARRMAEARSEMSHHGEYDYLVINESFDTALDDLLTIFTEERAARGDAARDKCLNLRTQEQVRRHRALIDSLLEAQG